MTMKQPEGHNWNQCESQDCFGYAPFNAIKGRQRRYCRDCERKMQTKLDKKNLTQREIDDRLLA